MLIRALQGSAATRCAICGSSRPGTYRRSSTGAVFCSSHPWCIHCRSAHLNLDCDEQRNLVRTHDDALRRTDLVLQDLQRLGLALPPVPLSLVSTLSGPQDGLCLKSSLAGRRVASITVRSGLGPTRFGHVVAHEHTHALVHLSAATPLNPLLEEGLCELVAVAWLTNRSTKQEVLNDVWANPHPAYGEQMRRLVTLAYRDGAGVVLGRVLTSGRPE